MKKTYESPKSQIMHLLSQDIVAGSTLITGDPYKDELSHEWQY